MVFSISVSVTPLIDDEVMQKIIPILKEFVPRLLKAAEDRCLLVRYHGDADGISGALAIKRAMSHYYKTIFVQNNSPFYEVSSALSDILWFRSEKPTILIIDFGSNKESEEALRLLKSNGFQILHIDHHPYTFDPKLSDLYVNPWTVGGESMHTAGMIAGELARLFGYADATELEKISLAGDKSTFVKEEWKGEAEKAALVLDYLAVTAEGKTRCIDVYEKALKNKEMFLLIYIQANAEIEDVLIKIKDMQPKESKRGFNFLIVNLRPLIISKRFPGRGAATGIVFDHFKNSGPLVVVGHFDGVFSIRVNNAAINVGFAANEEIEKMKKELGDIVLSAGGHKNAASLKSSREDDQLIANEFSKRLLGF